VFFENPESGSEMGKNPLLDLHGIKRLDFHNSVLGKL
jgi:hypothetical protein